MLDILSAKRTKVGRLHTPDKNVYRQEAFLSRDVRKLSDLNTIDQTKVDIVEHRFAKQALSSVTFQPLPILDDIAHNIDILWEMSFRFAQPVPN